MIYGVIAIFALMAACIVFGYSLRGIVNGINQSIAPQEDTEPDCNTCKYDKVKPKEEPCRTCLTQDVSMWEAKE